MPYFYQLQNRQRAKRAVVAGGLLVGLFLLVGFAPAQTLGWAGLGFGSLQVPQATVATAVEPVAVQVARVRAPASLEPLTFPAYAEWSDIETAGDWSFSYGEGGAVDAVDQVAMSRLEQTSGVLPGAANSSIYRTGSTAAGGSGGGGMGGGGGAGAGSASGEEAQEAQAAQAVEEAASDDGQIASGEAATTEQASRGNESGGADGGGGSSGGDSSSSSSSDRGSSDAGSSEPGSSDRDSSDRGSSDSASSEREVAGDASTPPDLILSPIAPDAGPSAAASLPREVVQALVESPVGTETVHSAGEPEAISAALDLDERAAATEGDTDAEQETVPEPLSLILVGLGLSAALFRHRRAVH